MNKVTIASMIDHTILKPATEAEINKLCAEANQYSFASVCVNPCWVAHCAKQLEESTVAVCTVVGFPLGENTTATKCFEAKEAIANGATEIDMVINQSLAKANMWAEVEADIASVVDACEGVLVKVIFETCNLTDEQIVLAAKASVNAGAIFVKTSTGFGTGGATVAHVGIMSSTVKDAGLFVKASGGVRTYTDALAMVEAGATRIGTSNGIAIVEAAE